MDPVPPINNVFYLVSQEEHQRNVNIDAYVSRSGFADSMAFYTKNDLKKTNVG